MTATVIVAAPGSSPIGTLGGSVVDTATVTGNPEGPIPPTGSLTYTLTGIPLASLTASGGWTVVNATTWTDTVVLQNGAVPDSLPTPPLPAGSYQFSAFYNGDATYSGSSGGPESLTVSKGDSSTATVFKDAVTGDPANGNPSPGTSVFDTATVTGAPAAFSPTGTVAYTFTGAPLASLTPPPGWTATSPTSWEHTVTLSGGLVPDSAPTPPLPVGSYQFAASYSGDNNYSGSTSDPEPFVVFLQVTVSGSQAFGSMVPTFTAATVPSGVSLSGTPSCTTVDSGTPISSSLAVGSYTIDGSSCSGLSLTGANAGNNTLSLSGGTFTVTRAEVLVTVSGTQSFGSTSPTFTATPTSGSLPSGVTLSGTPSCTTVDSGTPVSSSLAVGSHTIDGSSCSGLILTGPNAPDYALSLTGGPFTVTPSELPVTVSGSQTFGSTSPTFTATPPSGSLPSGVSLSGTPSCTTVDSGTPISVSLAAGSYTIDGTSCSGLILTGANGPDYALSLTGGPFTVGRATPTVTTTPTPSSGPEGTPLSATATVSGDTPTGTVTFDLYLPSDPTCTGTPGFTSTDDLGRTGTATSGTQTADAVGTWRWVATYSGDADYTGVTSGCQDATVTITAAAVTPPGPPSTVVPGASGQRPAATPGLPNTGRPFASARAWGASPLMLALVLVDALGLVAVGACATRLVLRPRLR